MTAECAYTVWRSNERAMCARAARNKARNLFGARLRDSWRRFGSPCVRLRVRIRKSAQRCRPYYLMQYALYIVHRWKCVVFRSAKGAKAFHSTIVGNVACRFVPLVTCMRTHDERRRPSCSVGRPARACVRAPVPVFN